MNNVLIIEKDEKLLNDSERFLSSLGYNIYKTYNGATGVQVALQHTPDIILCDSQPEGLSGYEVYDMIQQINSTSVIPFIFLTTKKSYNDLRTAMNLGIDDYLVKPFAFEDLKRLVEARLNKQKKIFEQANEKFKLLIDQATPALFIYQNEKLQYVNKRFCDILGYSQKELLGMNLVNVVYKDDIHFVIDKINRCFRGVQYELNVGFRAIKKNQDIFYVRLTGRIVTVQGKKNLVGSLFQEEREKNVTSEIENSNTSIEITSREKEVIMNICKGLSNSEIAEKLNLSKRTIEGHRNRLLKKTGCQNSVSLAIYAVKHGIYPLD
jgi:PAS domain S-box-containing protein